MTAHISSGSLADLRVERGKLSLAEALDRLLHCGVSVEGEVTIGIAGVELILLDLRLLLASVDTVRPRSPAAPSGPSNAPRLRRASSPVEDVSKSDRRCASFATPPAAAPQHDEVLRCDPQEARHAEARPEGASRSTHDGHAAASAGGNREASLVKLVLALVELLHDLLERQSLRRMTAGGLSAEEVEDLGIALQAQAREIERLRRYFGLDEVDLGLRLAAPDRLN